ncbi:hypothetical protein B7R54_00975 [Subtercola boreus]|uniref:PIN domain-containing protein n=1 Tax=Subtercola boreus TaxID=120213 RepID=A0A3E0VDH0_9MICO|nr:PIN domain-containing protein [Subtercola boreus]RFA07942.1 hypothetical protein B7R54_00975 [Subtercola boreus]TQL55195.1 PIN domain-containing protein [Subtercola boreus]
MAWNFLNKGVALDRAREQIGGVLMELNARLTSLSVDAEIAASLYLLFIEAADQRTRTLFSDPSVTQGFQTERYWRIREISTQTQRPIPLIESEVYFQLNRLSQIMSQLDHYSEILSLDRDEHALVLDTNVLLHGRMFNELDWPTIVPSKKVKLLIPLVVLDELDNMKDRDKEFDKKARTVIRAFDPYLSDMSPFGPHGVRRNVTIQFIDEPIGHQRWNRMDDEIVRQSVYFASACEGRFTVVSQDRGMRIRTRGVGIESSLLPLPFMAEKARQRADD